MGIATEQEHMEKAEGYFEEFFRFNRKGDEAFEYYMKVINFIGGKKRYLGFAFYRIGRIFYIKKDYKEAKIWFEKALKHPNEYREENIRYEKFRKESPKDFNSFYEDKSWVADNFTPKLLRYHQAESHYYIGLCMEFHLKYDFDKYIYHYKKAAEKCSNWFFPYFFKTIYRFELYYTIGRLYVGHNQYDNALKYFQLFNSYVFYDYLGNTSSASSYYDRRLKEEGSKNREDLTIKRDYHVALCYLKKNNRFEAFVHLLLAVKKEFHFCKNYVPFEYCIAIPFEKKSSYYSIAKKIGFEVEYEFIVNSMHKSLKNSCVYNQSTKSYSTYAFVLLQISTYFLNVATFYLKKKNFKKSKIFCEYALTLKYSTGLIKMTKDIKYNCGIHAESISKVIKEFESHKRLDDAIDICKRALDMHEDEMELEDRKKLVDLLGHLGKMLEKKVVKNAIQKVKKEYKKDQEKLKKELIVIEKAMRCYKLKKYDESIKYFKLALEMDNANEVALYMIGNIQLEQMKTTEALKSFLELIKLEGNHLDAYFSITKILVMDDKFHLAYVYLQKGMKLLTSKDKEMKKKFEYYQRILEKAIDSDELSKLEKQ